jgi:VIT1/CCC1 family predicted Fe2+/Mn2+ transporter
LTIAIADALSDAMGIHMAEESENKHTTEEVWESTFSTIFFKFIFSSIFILPVMLIELSKAIVISIMFGLYLLFVNSFVIAREQNANPWKIIGEHLIIAVLVIIATHYIGHFISILLR